MIHRRNGSLTRRVSANILILVLLFVAGACRNIPQAPAPVVSTTPEAQPVVESPVAPLVATETVVATSTPVPSSAQVVLIALPGADSGQAAALQETLSDLATQDGLTFETVTDPADLYLSPETRLVAALPPDPGIENLAQANPQTQFLAIGIPGVPAADNLSRIGSDGSRPDQQGFLAGYLAAVITQDWRVGTVGRSDTPAARAASNGFANGVTFFCGLCRPAYPPFIQYPIFIDLSTVSDPQAAVDALVSNAVKTVYLAPEAESDALRDLLAQAGLQIIASGAPSPQIADLWVAGISTDEIGAVRQIWPRLLAGEGGLDLSTPLALVERNAALFSLGRQGLVDKMLTDLLAGYVDSGVDPQTGEMR